MSASLFFYRPGCGQGGAHSRLLALAAGSPPGGCLPPSDSPSGSSSRFGTQHPPRRRHDLLDLLQRDVWQQLQHGGAPLHQPVDRRGELHRWAPLPPASPWHDPRPPGELVKFAVLASGRRQDGGAVRGDPAGHWAAEVCLHLQLEQNTRRGTAAALAPGRVPCPSAAAWGQRRPRVAPLGGGPVHAEGRQSAGRPASRRPSSPAVVRPCPRPIRG